MFNKRKNITKEQALKSACEENGLTYIEADCKPVDTITLVDDLKNENVIDKNLNIINK
jgi:hypothetical protein